MQKKKPIGYRKTTKTVHPFICRKRPPTKDEQKGWVGEPPSGPTHPLRVRNSFMSHRHKHILCPQSRRKLLSIMREYICSFMPNYSPCKFPFVGQLFCSYGKISGLGNTHTRKYFQNLACPHFKSRKRHVYTHKKLNLHIYSIRNIRKCTSVCKQRKDSNSLWSDCHDDALQNSYKKSYTKTPKWISQIVYVIFTFTEPKYKNIYY